jgi:hypothetical protein
MQTIGTWAARSVMRAVMVGAVVLGVVAPVFGQAPPAGTATQPGAWGRHGWVQGAGNPLVSVPSAVSTPASVVPASVMPAPAVAVPVAEPVAPQPAYPVATPPIPGTVRTGPNTTVTTSVTTMAPPAVAGGAWYGGQVLAVTPGYVVTTTTRTSEVIPPSSRATRPALAHR